MKEPLRLVLWALCAWLALLAIVGATVGLVLADAGVREVALLSELADHLGPRLWLAAVLMAAPAMVLVAWVRRGYAVPARQLIADLRVVSDSNVSHRTRERGSPELKALARSVNAFASAHEAMRESVEGRVREANLRLEQERGRLSALLAELAQSVIVCNGEGRVLLYNERAMRLLKEKVGARAEGRGAYSLIGLGRSIFTVFDRNVVLHALDTVQDRLAAGDKRPVVSFVTALGAGRLLRVEIAPAGDADGVSAGFVMVLHDVTRRIDAANRRERALQLFSDAVRGGLSRIRVAADRASDPEGLAPGQRDELLASIDDEARRLGERVQKEVSDFARALHQEWPLETMRGADLVEAASRRVQRKHGLPTKLEDVDESLWIEVDSYAMVQVLCYLAARLVEDFGIREVRFALRADDGQAAIEMIWTGAPLGIETTIAWQGDPLEMGGEVNPQTLSQIIARHHGDFRYEIRKLQHRECFRITLPVSVPEEHAWAGSEALPGRPEFYDFDLFHQAGQTAALDGMRLAALACTVFDTETTGLQPAEGDEIVSIGAVRILNGRVLAHEAFEQLVDPRRAMSSEAARITGIDDAMLTGQPPITSVLPAFHRYCEDSVLVAHNAAFDMRFLSLKEAETGLSFTHPVLDTLLLSEVIYPELESHRLEAIAERMGVRPIGRHTALGDAIMTAEVFLKMIPLLEKQGIVTLGQAREASRRTQFAKVSY